MLRHAMGRVFPGENLEVGSQIELVEMQPFDASSALAPSGY